MLPLFDLTLLDGYKSTHLLPFECEYCHKTFYAQQKFVKSSLKGACRSEHMFCDRSCYALSRVIKIQTICANCGGTVCILPKELKKSKSGNAFCSSSCAATYNNTHKKHGTRRSKLEAWLEEQLTELYPTIEIIFNGKETINSELDIYIPSMKLAFELNGIFHYEPIYGVEKLSSIQNNDKRKFQACLERGISLVIIDASKLTYFKPKHAQKYLDIITQIIGQHSAV